MMLIEVGQVGGVSWRAWTADTPEAAAAAAFKARYGREPEYIVRTAGRPALLLVGPVAESEVR